MKIRNVSLASMSAAAAIFGLGHVIGCSDPAADSPADSTMAALAACHLDDGTVEHDALVRACDVQDTKKTTICHLPPGNPANAHTLCIGNPAVPAHLSHHHGDHVGPCQNETPCSTPPPKGGTGGDGVHGTGGSSGTGGQNAGSGGVSGSGGNAVGMGDPIF